VPHAVLCAVCCVLCAVTDCGPLLRLVWWGVFRFHVITLLTPQYVNDPVIMIIMTTQSNHRCYVTGVSVQLMVQQPARARPRIAAAEQLSMRQLLEQYACATAMPPAALERAREVLQASCPAMCHVTAHCYVV
jgi:hypothetical protein